MIRLACVVAMGLVVGCAACGRHEGDAVWPSRAVKVIVPFGPGSGADIVTRLVAPRLSERWRQPVVVDNRPGGDGIVGVQTFVAADDEHTLLFTPAGQITLSPLLHNELPFDPISDLVPIAAVVDPSIGVAVGRNVAATSLADLSNLARSKPDKYRWAGVTGLPELIFKALLTLENVRMTHVPYRVQSMALQDLGAGRIHVVSASVATLFPVLQSGEARLLAVATSGRISSAPGVPTMKEAGHPELTSDGSWGFYGWRDMPVALRDRIAADVIYALNDAALVGKLEAMGLAVASAGAAEFAAAVDEHRRQVDAITSVLGMKPGHVLEPK